ncbi:MAG: DUF1116 domain-containing protein, partial [Okeania sp. SIO3B3]|nr:DUF1116 domain-containing protein [Okeania sp. SIO3B3]
LFNQSLTVVNVGLPLFAESLTDQHVNVIDVEWRPTAAGVPRLTTTKSGADIDALNQQVIDIISRSRPQWVGMGIAKDVIPGYHDKLILHSGPPITWDRMCGPQRGAVMGALVYEGLASSEDDAAQMAANGDVEFSPCHHYQTVGPMAGVVSPSMPVFIIENQADGNRAYATQNEGLGKVLRYGAFGEEVFFTIKAKILP